MARGLRMYAISEIALRCGIEENHVLEFIRREWIVPTSWPTSGLDEEDLARVRLIWQLREDLGVNDESVPIILHLIDQLHGLRAEIDARARRTG